MPSVMGLPEERERAARQRVDALQAELREAEAVWERFVIVREAVAEVLGEPRGEAGPSGGVAGDRPAGVVGAVPGSVVPVWRERLAVAMLSPDYQQLMNALTGSSEADPVAMDCRELAVAVGVEPVPAKVEGVWSKVKRLAARGWLAEQRPGLFGVVAGRGGGS
ncbi:hypothetical protein EDD96_6726 [Streptomyces sp. Ag109_G2-6]|uniref:hypothetical protein n=1 Tax=Streptomyces TaxID=1883 RepID=UPI0009A4D0BD|nr:MULTISPECIES: hypothetical protein [Streptomyces]RPF30148.1 hypothetical protein EDD96_6726 [Streptomyces sp. Ag109_G2-6]